jgi:shikimate kinase
MPNYILIGFASCGKTSVARELSIQLILDFIDLDEEIIGMDAMDNAQSRSCREIFEQDGEEAFRQLENQTLKSLTERVNGFVLATGGGAPMRPESRDIIKSLGTVIYLEANPQTIFDRMVIEKGVPAFLQHDPTPEGVSDILSTRHAEYEALSDLIIHTDRLTISEVTDIVIEEIS